MLSKSEDFYETCKIYNWDKNRSDCSSSLNDQFIWACRAVLIGEEATQTISSFIHSSSVLLRAVFGHKNPLAIKVVSRHDVIVFMVFLNILTIQLYKQKKHAGILMWISKVNLSWKQSIDVDSV